MSYSTTIGSESRIGKKYLSCRFNVSMEAPVSRGQPSRRSFRRHPEGGSGTRYRRMIGPSGSQRSVALDARGKFFETRNQGRARQRIVHRNMACTGLRTVRCGVTYKAENAYYEEAAGLFWRKQAQPRATASAFRNSLQPRTAPSLPSSGRYSNWAELKPTGCETRGHLCPWPQ